MRVANESLLEAAWLGDGRGAALWYGGTVPNDGSTICRSFTAASTFLCLLFAPQLHFSGGLAQVDGWYSVVADFEDAALLGAANIGFFSLLEKTSRDPSRHRKAATILHTLFAHSAAGARVEPVPTEPMPKAAAMPQNRKGLNCIRLEDCCTGLEDWRRLAASLRGLRQALASCHWDGARDAITVVEDAWPTCRLCQDDMGKLHLPIEYVKKRWKGPKQEWDNALKALHGALDTWLERPRTTEVKLVS